MLQLSEKFQNLLGELEFINFGSGIGIPYSKKDNPLDITSLTKSISNELNKFKKNYTKTKIIIEVGRYAVCKSGFYIKKVLDTKISYGKKYIILKNTLNGLLGHL